MINPINTIPFSILMSLGTCCANVYSFERILQVTLNSNTIITITQSIFILISLNLYCILSKKPSFGLKLNNWKHLIPIILQNITAYLTNYAFEFNVSMSTNIILRSTGTVITMIIGSWFYYKKYTKTEVIGAVLIAIGTVIFTLDIQSLSSSSSLHTNEKNNGNQFIGVSLLLLATILSSLTSLHKEKLFLSKVSWTEAMYFNYLYGLVIYIPLIPKILVEMEGFKKIPKGMLINNMITQLMCVSFVNILMVRVSALTLNIILLCRRIVSIIISIIYLGDGVSITAFFGVCFVILGAFIYILAVDRKLNRTLKID